MGLELCAEAGTGGVAWHREVGAAAGDGAPSALGLVYCEKHIMLTNESGVFPDSGIEWFALETNRDHSVVFEIAPKYCISDSFVDYEGYSISSKVFLPTVVDIMVI